MVKLYCYTDETGQDTKGKFFLVSIVLSDKEKIEELKIVIGKLEEETKGKTKWTKTDNKKKLLFLKEFFNLDILRKHLYYSVYENTTAYTPLTAMAISKAVIYKTKNYHGKYKVNIAIDGLRKKDKEIIRKELKSLDIKYNKIKLGLKDEQDILLRLADALAGFIRDYLENEKYAVDLIDKHNFKKIFIEV
jgi:hypothetical protein